MTQYRNEFATKKDLKTIWEPGGQQMLAEWQPLQEQLAKQKTYTITSVQVKIESAYPHKTNLQKPTLLGATRATCFNLQKLINQQFQDPKILRFIFIKNWHFIVPKRKYRAVKDEPVLAIKRRITYEQGKQISVWTIYLVGGYGFPPTQYHQICEVYTHKFVYLSNKLTKY